MMISELLVISTTTRSSSIYKYYDHGDPSYAGDCFWFVAQLRGIDLRTGFRDLLETIVGELGLRILVGSKLRSLLLPRGSMLLR